MFRGRQQVNLAQTGEYKFLNCRESPGQLRAETKADCALDSGQRDLLLLEQGWTGTLARQLDTHSEQLVAAGRSAQWELVRE